MQVSWIEPEEVRALASLLQDVTPGASSGAWDVQTLPDALGAPLLPQDPSPAAVVPSPPPPSPAEPAAQAAVPVAPPVPAPVHEPAPSPLALVAQAVRSVSLEPATGVGVDPSAVVTVEPATLNPDVILIREKLRIIRDRAKQAGLLTEEAPAAAQAPAAGQQSSFDSPSAPPAPSPLSLLPSRESIQSILRPAPVESEVKAAPQTQPENYGETLSEAAITAARLMDDQPVEDTALLGLPFPPIEGTMSERLDHFADWAAKVTASEEVLLVDDHGDLLWGNPSHRDIVISTMLAVQGALRTSAGSLQKPPTLLQTHVGGGREVSVLPCSTRHGLATLALINARGLNETSQPALREALVWTIEARSGS